ncbi:MAG: hypothetical protein M3O23_03915 [Actinomycetota bacterium]|nr:hypothetical protein [Actinomycetota bacterium]
MSRHEIEREAAAELGIQAQLDDEPSEPAPRPEPEEIAISGAEERRPRRGVGWIRDLLEGESAAARRERLEREAAAELGVHDRPEQPVG